MNNLQIFENADFGTVRVVDINGEPWFVGKDVCLAFGDSNYRRSLSRIDDCEKGVSQMRTPGGNQNMTIINESGLYSLLFAMEPQKANMEIPIVEERTTKLKKFKRWVTAEVLPAIRKTGSYNQLPTGQNLIALALIEANKILGEKESTIKVQQQIIGELKPLADYTDVILKNKGLVTITQISKDYGMSGFEMNNILHDLKVQYKMGDQWLLYAKHQKCGYTHSETINFKHKNGRPDVKMNTKWTQKGRLFIYDLLKEQRILPLIERDLTMNG